LAVAVHQVTGAPPPSTGRPLYSSLFCIVREGRKKMVVLPIPPALFPLLQN
jgi:hypothetical protein